MSDINARPTASGNAPSRRRRVLGHPLTHLLAALLVLGLTQAFVVKLFMVPSGSMEQTLEVGDRILVNRLAYGPPGTHGTPSNGDVIVFTSDDELWPRSSSSDDGSLVASVKHGIKFVFGDLIGIGPTTGHTLVKRVIGTPGQTVECCSAAGKLMVDGVEIDEPYVYEDLPFEPGVLDCESTPASQRCFPAVTVPEGMLLVLGDHRSNSADSVAACRGLTDASLGASSGEAGCVHWARIDDVYGKAFVTVWPLGRVGAIE